MVKERYKSRSRIEDEAALEEMERAQEVKAQMRQDKLERRDVSDMNSAYSRAMISVSRFNSGAVKKTPAHYRSVAVRGRVERGMSEYFVVLAWGA